MSGRLTVVGLGPGSARQMTPEAAEAVAAADVLFGYMPYLARLPERPGQERRASDNREEIARASAALEAAVAGAKVVMVSGGDPGVFAMAAAVFEAVEQGPADWRNLTIEVEPGITAMLAAAARLGAPLGGDFCAISLSDNLKPWDVVTARLEAVLRAGLSVALYNPISSARPWQLGRALALAAEILAPSTPVIFARAVTRPDEALRVLTLEEARTAPADMATMVIIGAPTTRLIERDGRLPFVYTPRSVTA